LKGDVVAVITDELVRDEVRGWLAENWDPEITLAEWWDRLCESGWAVPTWPEQWFGKGLPRDLAGIVNEELRAAGAIGPPSGLGVLLAGPTILTHGDDAQRERYLRPILNGQEAWCQLFSEPGAGSDLASLQCRAERDGEEWIINGQKVWTSLAHRARWGLLLARTNPDVPKHKGLTYFVIDMHGAGVETRPLRQMTGQAEFNEVYFTDARIPDAHRLGDVGNGWNVAMTTLMNERTALGGSGSRRGAGTISEAVSLWASRPHRQTPVLRDRLTQLWLRSEAQRLTSERSRASAGVGGPGPEGSIGKLVGAELNQQIYQFCMDFLGPEGILYHGYDSGSRIGDKDWQGPIQQRFLRSRANTIEGGTSEVMRNILGERILGLPGDLRADAGMPWKEIPRG
jgi:alkylation response protein AidB-like acyl-CoA dehydrogenase